MKVVGTTRSLSVHELFSRNCPAHLASFQEGNNKLFLCTLDPYFWFADEYIEISFWSFFELIKKIDALFFLTVINGKHMTLLTVVKHL